jgi:hypothetical protein
MWNSNSVLLERENRDWLEGLPEVPRSVYGNFSRPSAVTADDIRPENQGQIGSCQGNAITSCVERLLNVGKRFKGTELSRIYAYLASQQIDGLLGSDRGSTISAGIEVALKGIPSEASRPYPSPAVYPGRTSRSQILVPLSEEDSQYKAVTSWKVPLDLEQIFDFIGGGGAINIGIKWYTGIVPSDRIVKSYRPPRNSGGHALAVLGYTNDGMTVILNSHGDGVFYVRPDAMLSMLKDSWTAAVGVLGTTEPEPVNWIDESPLFLDL